MRRTLVWSVAMSTVVAVAITFMLNGFPLQRRGQSQHDVQVVLSIFGRSVTIGVSVEARQHSTPTLVEHAKIGPATGMAP